MKLSDFDYTLPKELIAQYPLKERDSARLLVLERKSGKIEHRTFRDITDYLLPEDILVLNNTKVLPCRLKGMRPSGGRVEILLLNQKSSFAFNALIKPGRVKLKEKIIFDGGKIYGELTAKNEMTFSVQNIDAIYKMGVMPLPPYIKRDSEGEDNIYYQTVYAKYEGAIASPTAGLHFTKELISDIESQGVNIAYITLHISYSTFKSIKTEDITKHKMDKEYFHIDNDALRLINQTPAKGNRIFAVGTTSCRALETHVASGMQEGYTDLFIYPGYKFKLIDCLLTNFHLPRTSLFILACAFAGERLIRKAYQEAIEGRYRFYSYGDAMLII